MSSDDSIRSWLQFVPDAIENSMPFPSIDPQPSSPASPKRSRDQSFGPFGYFSNSKFVSAFHLGGRKKRRLSEPIELSRPSYEDVNSGLFDSKDVDGMSEKDSVRPSDASIEPSSQSKASSNSPSRDPDFLEFKNPYNSRSFGERMTEHGLIINDMEAFDRSPKFQAKVFSIVESQRVSSPSPMSEKKLKMYLKEYDRASEGSFLMHIMPILLKDGFYTKNLKPEMSKEDRLSIEKEQVVFREFLIDEGLIISRNEELLDTLLPKKYTNQGFEEEMERALRKEGKTRNARPDFIFGNSTKKYPQLPMPTKISNLLAIAPGMYHPFLIIEGIGDQGSKAQAEDRCRRGGSTLVHAALVLNAEIANDDESTAPEVNHDPDQATQQGKIEQPTVTKEPTEDADLRTFMFSAIISPSTMDFYVNWYEGNQKDAEGMPNPLFHMNCVKSVSLKDRRALKEIRQTLHNICEWGSH